MRYFVPDLTPMDRPQLRHLKPKYLFVAESPHLSEVEPGDQEDRRPLCGVAGKAWWQMLSEILEGEANDDVSLERLLGFCERHKIAVLNAVRLPLDPKIATKYPDAEPIHNLGFAKASGEFGYKKMKASPMMKTAIRSLELRLIHPALEDSEIWCLGNDAEWFVDQALKQAPDLARVRLMGKIPHPSAWWRQDGLFGRIAEEKLRAIFEKETIGKAA